jgi:predicted AlkP superfamily pyrophosphatase or phosphodiesterase
MRNFLTAFLVFALASCQSTPVEFSKKEKNTKPKLVVGIVVDQMRYDFLTRFANRYGQNGFAKLQREGFSCQNHHFNYMPTKTGPGHASIFTGTTPSVHGIIANDWYVKETKSKINCVSDSSVFLVGSLDEGKPGFSPKQLLTTTLGDQIRKSTQFRGKSIGVSLKNRGAILPAGKMANGAYWFSETDGSFQTSTYYRNELPDWVNDFNSKNLSDQYLSQLWETLFPIETYVASSADCVLFEHSIDPNSLPIFPYNLSEIRKSWDYELLKITPFGNDLLLEFAKAALKGEELGKDSIMDFLSISFSSTDEVGHRYGPNSIEIEDIYLRLDRNISELIDYLDTEIGQNAYLLFLTSDHGVAEVPKQFMEKGLNIGYYSEKAIFQEIKQAVIQNFGYDLVENFSNCQFYLNDDVLATSTFTSQEVENFIVKRAIQIPGVKMAFTRKELSSGVSNKNPDYLVQNGWNQERSGEVALVMELGWISNAYEEKGGTTHGSPWNYDTHVPLIFYGNGVPKGKRIEKSFSEEIVPTICQILGLEYPMGSTGNPILLK